MPESPDSNQFRCRHLGAAGACGRPASVASRDFAAERGNAAFLRCEAHQRDITALRR